MSNLLLDVSNNQGVISWEKVGHSRRFVGAYLKATEGHTYEDSRFRANRIEASLYLHVGAYHFARFGDVKAEAANFLTTVMTVKSNELRPVLDVEADVPTGVDAGGWIQAWNQIIHAELGVWPLLYSYGPWIRARYFHQPLGDGLWLADYGADDGTVHDTTVPPPWKRYVLHQFTDKGRVDGIQGNVDLNVLRPGITIQALLRG